MAGGGGDAKREWPRRGLEIRGRRRLSLCVELAAELPCFSGPLPGLLAPFQGREWNRHWYGVPMTKLSRAAFWRGLT